MKPQPMPKTKQLQLLRWVWNAQQIVVTLPVVVVLTTVDFLHQAWLKIRPTEKKS